MPGVGPGALADPSPFLALLAAAGVAARVERETLWFDFVSFEAAWEALAGVTVAQLPPAQQRDALASVQAELWPHADRPRFCNVTQFIVGTREPAAVE